MSRSAEPNDGRYVRQILAMDGGGNLTPFSPGNGHVMIYEYYFHGDWDDAWIVMRTLGERKEVERWNARYVNHIEWSDAFADAEDVKPITMPAKDAELIDRADAVLAIGRKP